MAKFEEPFVETQEMYTEAIRKCGLNDYVNITIITNNKSKDIFKVIKANEILSYRTGDDVIIVLNEKVFEQLTPEQREIIVYESLASISYNTENDKIVISKPDVITFSGILSKYSFETWNVLRESIITLYKAEEEEEDRAKATTETR